MKLWLASSDLDLIERMMPLGVWQGVITNPAVVAEAKRAPAALFADLCALAPAAWYQLADAEPAAMLDEARAMLAVDPARMRIKVPATRGGLQTIHTLAGEGHAVMATTVPTQAWMLFALAAGAAVIAPYGGMLQRRGIASKADEVIAMQRLIDVQGYAAEICTGIYEVTEIPYYAARGVRSGFVWGRDADRFLTQPLVDEAVAGFEGAWQEIGRY